MKLSLGPFTRKVVTFAVFALAVACGKSQGSSGSTQLTSASPAPKGGSCVRAKAGTCTEFGDNTLGVSESMCTSIMKGTYSKDACPTQNMIGTCAKKDDKEFYYAGNTDAPWLIDAQNDCENNPLVKDATFKFTPAPNVNEEQLKANAMPSADKIIASCTQQDGSCSDVLGSDMMDMEKSLCEGGQGTYSTNACPTAGLVGSCLRSGKVDRYYTKSLASMTPADLAKMCSENTLTFGHYYPGPNAPADKPAPVARGAKAKSAPKKK